MFILRARALSHDPSHRQQPLPPLGVPAPSYPLSPLPHEHDWLIATGTSTRHRLITLAGSPPPVVVHWHAHVTSTPAAAFAPRGTAPSFVREPSQTCLDLSLGRNWSTWGVPSPRPHGHGAGHLSSSSSGVSATTSGQRPVHTSADRRGPAPTQQPAAATQVVAGRAPPRSGLAGRRQQVGRHRPPHPRPCQCWEGAGAGDSGNRP